MKIDIQYLAKLASLYISKDEEARLKKEMEMITAMAANLPVFDDTEIIMPEMRLREDIICDSYSREELLKNGSQTENGYFSVPKVIE